MSKKKQPAWLRAALDYVPEWMDFQVRRNRQPGCSVAIVQGGELAGEWTFGSADLGTGAPLTPRHRFRVASHSKTFTATGVMLLREQGKLSLDDPVGRFVPGLHKDLARARISEVLSHGAGITRDGADAGQFLDRKPWLTREELLAELAVKQPIAPGMQLKYSNHGYALLGLLIEHATATPYVEWIRRHVIEPAGLRETVPDMAFVPKRAPMAKGHGPEFPFERRLVVPGDSECNAIAAAAGFVSTAADIARFFAQLAPESAESVLSPASRREMMRRQWRDEHNLLENYYGLGLMIGPRGAKEWVGHTGGFQGFMSRTARFTATNTTITVLCNSQDPPHWQWVDGLCSIVNAFKRHGAPDKRAAAWNGRWWYLWGAMDLVPMGDIVCAVAPGLATPFDAATIECEVTGKDVGVFRKTSAYGSPGQGVRIVRDGKGRAREFWLGGMQLLPEEAWVKETEKRYATAGDPRLRRGDGARQGRR